MHRIIFSTGEDVAPKPPEIISPTRVEKELSDANIDLSDTDEYRDLRKLKQAIVEVWEKKQPPGEPQKSFEDITVPKR